MATAPNCSKNALRVRLRRARYMEEDREEERWSRALASYKYPDCIPKGFFDDCPQGIADMKNPPAACKSCPQYVPSVEDIKYRMRAFMEEMSRSRMSGN